MKGTTVTTFSTPGPVALRLEVHRGRIRVTAETTDQTLIELRAVNGDAETQALIDQTEIRQDGDVISVIMPKEHGFSRWLGRGPVQVDIRVPKQSRLDATTGSASLETVGELGDLRITTGSGDVRVSSVAAARIELGSASARVDHASGACSIKSGSGRVELGQVDGDARATTGSGAVVVGKARGQLVVRTASGAIEVEEAGPDSDLSAASGAIRIGQVKTGRMHARTVSGRVSIGVALGTAAWLDASSVSGGVRSDLETSTAPREGEDKIEIHVKTVSGQIRLRRAAVGAVATA